MRRKIVVFGGTGFIGSYLIDELLKNSYDVVAVDINPSKYVDEKYYVKCDILDMKQVDKIVKDAFMVYNFAVFANLDDAIDNPYRAMELNVMGNLNILEACREHHIKRFVYASSGYAVSDKGSFYGISKLASEKLIEEYYKKFGLEFTIVRYGSVYAGRDYQNNYIYNLLKQAVSTGKILHNGDENEMHEYIHAADVAKLAVDIIQSDTYINEHIILTGVERMPKKELFAMINEILGGTIAISLDNNGYHNHYKTTPYSFAPIRSKKLVANPYIDIGQGLVDCLKDIEKKKDSYQD